MNQEQPTMDECILQLDQLCREMAQEAKAIDEHIRELAFTNPTEAERLTKLCDEIGAKYRDC